MNKIINTIEIWFWQIAIKILEKGYGEGCPDFEKDCVSCQSKKTVDFIRKHIELIKFFR